MVFLLCLATFLAAASGGCDTVKIKALTDKAGREMKTELRQAHTDAANAYSLAQACGKTPAFYAALAVLTRVYYFEDKPDSSLALLKPVVGNNGETLPQKFRGTLLHRMGSAYIMLQDLEPGLKYTLLALKEFELINDTVSAANALVNIANCYQQQNNFKQADKALRNAEKTAAQLPNKTTLGNVYNTMGILYAEHSQLDSAEKFFLLSTGIREKLGDETSIVWNYNNLGGIYLLKREPKKAEGFLLKALKLFEQSGNYDGQSSVANNLAEVNMQIKNYKETLKYYTYSRKIYSLTNDKDNLENLYNNLSNYYDITGDLKTAFRYSDSLIVLKDTLYGQRLDRSMAEMQTKFDLEKRDIELLKNKAELRLKQEESKQKSTVIILIIVGFAFVILLLLLMVWHRQQKMKMAAEAELARQKEIRAKAIIEAEEKERIRIAKDLHDGVGQILSAAKMNLSSVQEKLLPGDESDRTAFKNALDLLDESVKEVRAVSHNMMPHTLLKLGLASAVREFVTKLQGSPSLKINLEIVGLEGRLEPEKESVLYRVIQELVANVVKHAKASVIGLQLIRHEKELTIVVEDNGVGFDASRKDSYEGIGLKNIISRIEFVNGSINIDSSPGKGATVIIEIPV